MRGALRNADLPYRLRALPMSASVLHVGSHPDDEDSGLLAYLSRGLAVRTVYWSATRGEGGQNRVGRERGEALGVLRTWESLDARTLDGGEVLYGPFYDFGFSRSGDDTLVRWGRTGVVREIVRAIRIAQPDVVVSRWSGTPEDGHGQHEAVGATVSEAFDAAGEPEAFPELDLPPWRPLKLYRSAFGDWQPGEDHAFGARRTELDEDRMLEINTGEFDPISGRSYQELAWIGVGRHRSQGMEFLPARGDFFTYLRLERSEVDTPTPERGPLDGFDPTLTGLADRAYAGASGGAVRLRSVLEAARAHAEEAVAAFRPHDPEPAGDAALRALWPLREARGVIDDEVTDEHVAAGLRRALGWKIRRFEEAAARCLGLHLECLVDEDRVTPGETVTATVRLWRGGRASLEDCEVNVDAPPEWSVAQTDSAVAPRGAGRAAPDDFTFDIGVPETEPLSTPYWLRRPREPYRYVWPEEGSAPPRQTSLGLPFDRPLVSATAVVNARGTPLTLRAGAVHREAFGGGWRDLWLHIVPPITLRPREPRILLPAGHADKVELHLVARSMRGDVSAVLTPETLPGWDARPAEVELSFPAGGQEQTITVELSVLPDAKPGVHDIRYRLLSGRRDYGVVLNPVFRRTPSATGPADESTAIAQAYVARPAVTTIHLLDATFVRRLRYAYVSGVEEDILSALAPFDLDMTLLDSDALAYADLGMYEAVVVGPNAYVVRDDVRRNAGRLLEYVENGGTLIVQYQGYDYQRGRYAPYPFRFHQPHDRVTFPDAPVRILEPEHPVLTVPNPIGDEDFEEWVHDRGMYFFGEWDKRYLPLLESGDPGGEPARGGLLVAHHGRGTYVYAAYSFFRQIPVGVPGAVRLFANLLGLPEARITERARVAGGTDLFSSLDEAQLYDLARLMSERWVDAGTVVAREGQHDTELYVVVDGEVDVISERDGQIAVVGPGEPVGEVAVLADVPRSATLRARTDVKLLGMRGRHLRGFLRAHPDVSERLLSTVAKRLSEMVRRS